MGGILGLWNRDGQPVDVAILRRKRETMAHRRDVHVLAVTSPGTHVVCDGRLDNREELVDRLALRYDVDTRASDGALVQAAYREWDRGFAAHLSGDFATAVFDAGRRTLLLARDALGVRPLYYYATPTLLVFASEIKALLAHPAVVTRPNEDVLADYLFNLLATDGDRGATFFADVRAVQPSHLVAVTAGEIRETRYWDFDPSVQLPVRTIEEAADGFREHFTRAVRRRLRTPGPVAISVSGGLDSSAIACTAAPLSGQQGGPPVFGCSYTVADGLPSDEKQYLGDIERMHGLTIHRWQDLPTGLIEGSREGIRHLEMPGLDTRWTGTLAYYRAIRDLGARALLTGHWGDQFQVEDGFLVDLLCRGRWIRAWRDGREYRRWKDHGAGDVARNLPRALARHLLPAAVLRGLQRVRGRGDGSHDLEEWYTPAFMARGRAALMRPQPEPPAGPAHARALYRQARSRYHVLGMEWNNKLAAMHGFEVAFPFLDRDLIGFLMAIPGELVTWQGVPKGLLRVALRGILPPAIAERRSKADFSLDVNTETAQDYGKLVAEVRAGGRAAALGYISSDAVRRLDHTPAADADTCTLSWALTDVLSLELWLQAFFGDRTGAEHA